MTPPAEYVGRIMREDEYQRLISEQLAARNEAHRLLADLKVARATAMQANVCITRLVAALAEVAPSHPLLTELPFSQYRDTNTESTEYR